LAIDLCQDGKAISQAKRVVCPCGRLKLLYLLLGKRVDWTFQFVFHLSKETGCIYLAKAAMQRVSMLVNANVRRTRPMFVESIAKIKEMDRTFASFHWGIALTSI
jgi:hypothetical protein